MKDTTRFMREKTIILSENKPEFEQLSSSSSPSSPGAAVTVAFVAVGSHTVAAAGSPGSRRLRRRESPGVAAAFVAGRKGENEIRRTVHVDEERFVQPEPRCEVTIHVDEEKFTMAQQSTRFQTPSRRVKSSLDLIPLETRRRSKPIRGVSLRPQI
ncbi:hypothetical protein Drorol1_Dr00022858 [Drosera rotundifolia]